MIKKLRDGTIEADTPEELAAYTREFEYRQSHGYMATRLCCLGLVLYRNDLGQFETIVPLGGSLPALRIWVSGNAIGPLATGPVLARLELDIDVGWVVTHGHSMSSSTEALRVALVQFSNEFLKAAHALMAIAAATANE